VDAFDPDGVDELELVAQPGQAGGRSLRVEKLARVRLEGQHAGSELQLARLGADALDQRAVAAVHAVEVAYGQRTPAPGALQRAVRDDHGLG
jgi:hypothetical protein